MKQSLSYYLILLVFRLKGLKKTFSQSPVNVKKLRKDDIHGIPNGLLKKENCRQFRVLSSAISEIKSSDNKKLILFIHGGAFVSGPAQHHWDMVKHLIKTTEATVWMCDYPKAPESKIEEINRNMDAVFAKAKQEFKTITVMGDSVGGNLAMSLTQRLIKQQQDLPSLLLLITPVLDASFSNPEIDTVDKSDPMLSKKGVLSAKKMAYGSGDLKDSDMSPIYGEFRVFPKTVLFLAENDITYPDQKRLIKKLDDERIDFEVVLGENMPHIWPLLPVMHEAKTARTQISEILNAN
jgi:acetyl esterase/lipase